MSNNEIKEYKEPKLEELLLEDGPNGDVPNNEDKRSAEYSELYYRRRESLMRTKRPYKTKLIR